MNIQEKALTVREELFSKKEQFQMALPKWLSVDRLLRVVFSSLLKNPKLLDCTRESLFISIMQCAQTGLEPILGRAYLIPYNNSKKVGGNWVKVMECQFQPGYQGLVDLARRSGEVKDVFAMVVYEKDDFDLEYGTNRRLIHKPYLGEDAGNSLGAYTVWENKEGLKNFEFMPLHEIYKRRDKSQAYRYAIDNPKNEKAQECPWIQWPEEQMRKTVVKHHSKLQPASIEFMEAVEIDNMAEIGKPLLPAPFPGGPFLVPEKGEEEPIDQSTLVEQFDSHIDPPEEALISYIQQCADHFNKGDVAGFKANVIKDNQFEGFWKAYKAWKEKQEQSPVDNPPIEVSPETSDDSSSSGTDTTIPDDIQSTETKEPPDQNAKVIDEFKNFKKPSGLMKWVANNCEDIPHMAPIVKNALQMKWLRTCKDIDLSEFIANHKIKEPPEEPEKPGPGPPLEDPDTQAHTDAIKASDEVLCPLKNDEPVKVEGCNNCDRKGDCQPFDEYFK